MALPIIVGAAAGTAAGTAAIAAYLNAKFHILHDLRNPRAGLAPSKEIVDYLTGRVMAKRVLLFHVLEDHALHHRPDHPFLIFEGQTWTYRQFYDCIIQVANWLMKDMGVDSGEMVAIDGGNSPEYYMLWFALDAIGAKISFLNWNLTGAGLVHCVKLCESRFVIADTDVRNNLEPCREELEGLSIQIQYYSPSFFASLTDTTPIPPARYEDITIDSVRSLLYTSGTTGLPKGVIFTTGRELVTGYSSAKYLQLTPNDRMYTCMPLYHGAAHGLCTSPCIHAGATIVLGRRFSHKTFWPEVARSRATIIQYVGELCRYLLNGPANEHERSHCVQMAWGNGMRPDVWEPFRERFRIPVINELYAATDGLGATFNKNYGPFTANCIGLRGLIWHWRYGNEEVRVKMDVDTEDIVRDGDGFAIRCGVDEPGQVLHRLDPKLLDSVPGYYKNEKATLDRRIADVFEKGDLWFKSGDMHRVDADGRVFFADRLGDTFRWKSENVSTNEVADALGRFPQIAEPNVYGVLVPGYDGRAGAASIVLADGVTLETFDTKALARYVRDVLPGYAVPLFLRVTPALEYTGTLKMQKGRLKREGVDLEKVGNGDVFFWLPPGSDRYVPYERKDWEALKNRSVRLT
ncbi:long-chain fatty acid transporter-like protein [Westerdykella ornata]|uniref:Very long-chain fatty acid transport protein n=1 Tax=Westerdykella ornata TaxID=318751 RepID=A0A6A6J5B9_WESOR|nr:long-chain fatty acid transporter-like protein [Westerdykella ornata]KAF2271414.1 long-chain fatty acid transporter-like protein [Westerdykella ornata]